MRRHRTLHRNAQGIFQNKMSLQKALTFLSLVLNVVLLLRTNLNTKEIKREDLVWHGGSLSSEQHGSCWCSDFDGYCMCTPSLSIDLILVTTSESQDDSIWLVRRKDTGQLAIMGGFVNVGETVQQAVVRELQEEMAIAVKEDFLKLFGIYSDPRRDDRRHTASAVFVAHVSKGAHPTAADDARDVQLINIADIDKYRDEEYYADHKAVLLDYRNSIASYPKTASQRIERKRKFVRALCPT